MCPIRNSCIGSTALSPCNQATAGFTFVLAISAIALSIIGLTSSSSGPFNAIVHFGTTTHGTLLGASIFILILDLFWVATFCKKKKQLAGNHDFVLPSSDSEKFGSKISDPANRQFSMRPTRTTDASALSIKYSISMAPTACLLDVVILKIFSYLRPNDLGRICSVSKKWHQLASDKQVWDAIDLRTIPSLNVYDGSDWRMHVENLSSLGLDVEDEPLLDNQIVIPTLIRTISSLKKEIEDNEGFTLLTIPKGLKFDIFLQGSILNCPRIYNSAVIQWLSKEITENQVKKTYRVLITNNIFEMSRTNISDPQAFLKERQCRIPTLLEVTTLMAVTFMQSGTRLYSKTEYDGRLKKTLTQCLETVDSGWGFCKLYVGEFDDSNLILVNRDPGGWKDRKGHYHNSHGVGGIYFHKF